MTAFWAISLVVAFLGLTSALMIFLVVRAPEIEDFEDGFPAATSSTAAEDRGHVPRHHLGGRSRVGNGLPHGKNLPYRRNTAATAAASPLNAPRS